MRLGGSDNPSYAATPPDTCYYSIIPEDNFFENCHATSFEITETDMAHERHEVEWAYSEDEFEIREVDIVDTDLEYNSAEDCRESRRPIAVTGTTTLGTAITASVYPNPSTGTVFVNLEGMENVSIKVFATTGELVSEPIVTRNNIIEIKGLPNGVYLISITDATGHVQNEKVIVK